MRGWCLSDFRCAVPRSSPATSAALAPLVGNAVTTRPPRRPRLSLWLMAIG